MGLNFLKKLFGNVGSIPERKEKDIKEELKTILHDKWEEQKKNDDIPFDELYSQMVEEAVLTIKEEWRREAEYHNNFKSPVNELQIEAYEAFVITEDLMLHSDNLYRPYNPKTGRKCFYSNFTFPNVELADQYMADVMALLPEGTFFEFKPLERPKLGKVMAYSFSIKLTDLQS